MKKLSFTVLFLISIVFMSFMGCGNSETTNQTENNNSKGDTNKGVKLITEKTKVEIEMENGDKMVFELDPKFAPETVTNFVNLVNQDFYKGLTFHRIIKDFMIQGGDPLGTGMGGSSQKIKGEFSENGFKENTLNHTRGIISMARSGDPNSASSQFFICTEEAKNLDGKYAAFGKLVEGDDVLKKLSETPVDVNNSSGELSKPKVLVKMKNIKVIK